MLCPFFSFSSSETACVHFLQMEGQGGAKNIPEHFASDVLQIDVPEAACDLDTLQDLAGFVSRQELHMKTESPWQTAPFDLGCGSAAYPNSTTAKPYGLFDGPGSPSSPGIFRAQPE